jgi:cytochrome c peroxidase
MATEVLMRATTTGLCSLSILAAAVGCGGGVGNEAVGTSTQALEPAPNSAGVAESFHTSGSIDRTNPFFRVFGTNGRTCATCHDSRTAWTMTPGLARELFEDSDGLAPLFRRVDETVRPDADISTREARRDAFAMLLKKGLTRFTRTIKPTAEFEVAAVDDPYGWSTPASFSNFRRIPSTSNAAHQSSVTWTGGPADVRTNIAALMVGGTKLHGETTFIVSPADAAAGADFLMGLSFAQSIDRRAGRLDVAGATGGPANLSAEPFYLGINALGGDSKTGAAFNNQSFNIYEVWETAKEEARKRLGRGESAFYTLDIAITGVPGINDALGQPVVNGHCTTCHNTPNVGSHSEFRMIDNGLTGPERSAHDVPLVTLRNKTTGETRQTTDVGRALSTGLWADIGKFKVPTLRGVGSRAPYFHDGSADSLEDVLDFYERRFGIDFHGQKEDIIAFLKAL